MLSLGTELFFAFWMASNSVGLPAGSPPPVRAATSMFLISLANSLPRLASMTAFLCLVVAHLEWPLIDPAPSPSSRTARAAARPRPAPGGTTSPGGRPAAPRRSYRRTDRPRPRPAPRRRNRPTPPRRPDEHRVERAARHPVDRDRLLEGVDLPAEGVAPDRHVQAAEGLLALDPVQHPVGEQDHPRAGPVRRHAVADPLAQRLQQVERDRQLGDRGRLTARDDQGVDAVQLAVAAH